MRTSGWTAFSSWAGVGVLYGFATLRAMSIGVLVLPIAILATVAAARNVRAWPEILGLSAGPAAVLLWLAWRASQLTPCASRQGATTVLSNGAVSVAQPGAQLTFTASMSCTSLNTTALALAGVALGLATLIAYRVSAR